MGQERLQVAAGSAHTFAIMCRWLAYQGPPITLETLLFQPENALVRQSIAAKRAITPVNGDGFGLAWWGGAKPSVGLFRDTLPAWNDSNLLSLAEQIEAGQFFAHVRASTGTATSRVNCHPFAVDRLAFMHNGQVGEWGKVRRKVEALIPDELYPHRLGTTDSEALFLLATAHGLPDDPLNALAKAVGQITAIMEAAKIDAPFRITAAFGDGQKTVAIRWSSDQQSPSLYYATGGAISCVDGRLHMQPGVGATLILSEPLDENEDWWTPVPDASVLIADKNEVRIEPFSPAA